MSMNSVKGLTRKELADGYGISLATLREWLKREVIVLPPGYITPKMLAHIKKKIGVPPKWVK